MEEGGIARFPDAPTERGVKHIYELCKAADEGYYGYILFVIQMSGITSFEPNDRTHPAFGEALRYAEKRGIRVLAYDCEVTENSLMLRNKIQVNL